MGSNKPARWNGGRTQWMNEKCECWMNDEWNQTMGQIEDGESSWGAEWPNGCSSLCCPLVHSIIIDFTPSISSLLAWSRSFHLQSLLPFVWSISFCAFSRSFRVPSFFSDFIYLFFLNKWTQGKLMESGRMNGVAMVSEDMVDWRWQWKMLLADEWRRMKGLALEQGEKGSVTVPKHFFVNGHGHCWLNLHWKHFLQNWLDNADFFFGFFVSFLGIW